MRKLLPGILTVVTLLFICMAPSKTYGAQDSLTIQGKGIYLWQLWSANGGGKNLSSVITELKSIGATWVVTKMGDGDSYYNSPNHSLYNWASSNYGDMDSVVAIFHANGIKLLAFQYVRAVPHYWGNPVSETDVANSILSIKGIDGLIIDAEIEYDTSETREASAQAYCDSIHAHHPNTLLGLTAWARVDGHITFPWRTFLDRVVVNMPQTYWAARPTSVQNELSLMSGQFSYWINTWVSLGDSACDKPIMPIGQGEKFIYGNDVAQGEITNFCNLSQFYGYPGVSLWEYNQIAHSYVWNEYASSWQVTGISNKTTTPVQYNLSQNYPNPFNPATTINYSIPKESFVTIKIYDVLGKEVTSLVNKIKPAGKYSFSFYANNLSSGIYYYQIQAGDFVLTHKMILLK